MTDSGTKVARANPTRRTTTSTSAKAKAATKPNTLKSAPASSEKDPIDAADKICKTSSGSSLGPGNGKKGSGFTQEIRVDDTSSCGGKDTEITRRVESNNNVKEGEVVGAAAEEDVTNNNIVESSNAQSQGVDNGSSSASNSNDGSGKDGALTVDQSKGSGDKRGVKSKTSKPGVAAGKTSTSSGKIVSSTSKPDENTHKQSESDPSQRKLDELNDSKSLNDTDEDATNSSSTATASKVGSCSQSAEANATADVKRESRTKQGGNDGAADTDSSCEDIPDRYSLEEERGGGAVTGMEKSLGALAVNWERYFVRVGEWLVSATEGADSNPPSDHEEENADANKAGFASGLANFNLSGVSSRASASAKTVGSFFGTAFSKASASVKEAGSKIKETVEKNPLLSEFNKEQEAFIAAKGGKVGETLPPWVGYPEEDKLKEEILGLATERKNFVRNPPTGVIFEFDLEQFLPVAQATLAADPNLEKMRFELVPKVVTEEVFWRNYFYRVGLIRQSTELSSLEQDGATDTPAKQATDNKAAAPLSSEPSSSAAVTAAALEAAATDAPEFVSESFQPSSEDVEEMKRGISSLTGSAG